MLMLSVYSRRMESSTRRLLKVSVTTYSLRVEPVSYTHLDVYKRQGLFMNQLQTNYQIVAQAYQLTAGESKALLDAVSMMKPIAWALDSPAVKMCIRDRIWTFAECEAMKHLTRYNTSSMMLSW